MTENNIISATYDTYHTDTFLSSIYAIRNSNADARRAKSAVNVCFMCMLVFIYLFFIYLPLRVLCKATISIILPILAVCFQCFDTVGWAAGRASGL